MTFVCDQRTVKSCQCGMDDIAEWRTKTIRIGQIGKSFQERCTIDTAVAARRELHGFAVRPNVDVPVAKELNLQVGLQSLGTPVDQMCRQAAAALIRQEQRLRLQ